MKRLSSYIVLTLAASALSACSTTAPIQTDVNPQGERQEKIESAIDKVTEQAAQKGSLPAKLVSIEKQYQRDSENPAKALRYAQALRHAGYLNRAALVLEPFAKDTPPAPGVNTEFSMIELGQGNHDAAERYAQQAVLQDPFDHLAYQNLGIALDAKEMHPEAERAFRKGLEHWQGDPTTIMNNLALNLATQGFIDEAIQILERAKKISPDRIELERNLRIVRTLNER